MLFFKEHLGGNKFNSIVSNHHIIILSCCVRNETTRKMKIDEVESTTKKARVATHTHIKVLFFTNTSSSSSLSLSSCNQCAKPKLLRVDDAVNRHRGRFLFLSLALSRSRVLFSLSPRDETNVFAKRTTGSRGKRER